MDNLENFIIFENYVLVELEVFEEPNEFGLITESRNTKKPMYTDIGKVVKIGNNVPDHISLNDRVLVTQQLIQPVKIQNKDYFRVASHTLIGKYVPLEKENS